MGNKLASGDTFPAVTLTTVNDGEITLPQDIDADFAVVLFYRGHWWPFCRQQLVGFEKAKDKLTELGVKVFAGSVDSMEDTTAVQQDVSFPIAHGVERSTAELLGAWWNEERAFMQPSQFLMRGNGDIIQSTYSDGPLGRILADDVCGLVGFLRKNGWQGGWTLHLAWGRG